MAHDSNGRIYVDTQNGVGIGIQEVNAVLGAGSLDLGTLCRATSLINGYAKKKPLAAGNVGGYTEAQAKAINYGLYVPYYTTFRDMVRDIRRGVWSGAANYDSTKTPWTNAGLGAGDWARLLDFNGYQHNAPQPVAQIFARNEDVGLGFTPEFEADLATYNVEFLVLSDIGVTVNGTDYRGSNMYVGLVACDGNTDSLPVSDRTNFWEQMSLSATQLNTEVSRYLVFYGENGEFAFDRGKIPPTYNAPACFFLSSVSNRVSLDSTGVFIPIIPTRNVIGLEFVPPSMVPVDYDPQNAWWFEPNSANPTDLTLIIRCYPNGNFKGKFDINIEDANGDAWAWNNNPSSVVDAYRLSLNLYKVKELIGGEDVQKPVFIRISTGTDGSYRVITATTYITSPDTDFVDVHAGYDHEGNPLVADSSDTKRIRGGSILNGVTPDVANIAIAYIDYSLGTDADGYVDQGVLAITP